MHLKRVSQGFNIYQITFGDNIVTVLALHIRNHLSEMLKAGPPFQTFKRSLSDWIGPKYKCVKLAVIWIFYPKVLLHSEPNIEFDLPYFILFIVNKDKLSFFFTLYLFKLLSEN